MAKNGKSIDLTAGVMADVARESARRTKVSEAPAPHPAPAEASVRSKGDMINKSLSLYADQMWLVRQHEFRTGKQYRTSAIAREALDEYFVRHAEELGIADLIGDDGSILRPADGHHVI